MLSFGLSLLPMKIDVLPQTGGEYTDTPAGFDLAAIIADVMNSGFRVSGKPMRTGGVRTIVEARCGDGDGKLIQTVTFLIQFIAEVYNVLAFRMVHGDGRQRLGQRLLPTFVHFVCGLAAHPEKIDRWISRQSSDNHGHIVLPSLSVGDVFEQP